jgi:hypothetical protein
MKVRIYFPHLPTPSLGGSELLVFEQMRTLHELGHQLYLCTWHPTDPSHSLTQLPSASNEVWPPFVHEDISARVENNSRLTRVIRSNFRARSSTEAAHYPDLKSGSSLSDLPRCDLAIYTYSFAHAWLQAPAFLASESRRVVYFHNLENVLAAQRAQAARLNLLEKALHLRNAKFLRQNELNLTDYADELWFVSPYDLELWQKQKEACQVALNSTRTSESVRTRLVGPTLSGLLRKRSFAAFEARVRAQTMGRPPLKIGFIGNLGFHPNRVGVEWLLKKVLPILTQAGFKGQFLIAGRNACKSIQELASQYANVRLLGEITDLEEFYSDLSYLAVPHLQGSGVRMKTLEAITRGIPVLTHPEGAQGIDPSLVVSPQVTLLPDANDWASFLNSRLGLIDRAQILEANPEAVLPPALEGKEIYSFLAALAQDGPKKPEILP